MGTRGGTPSRREVPSVGTLGLPQARPTRRKKVPVSREYVGIDLHRRRSVIVRKNSDGEVLSKVHIDNDPIALAAAVSAAGSNPEVVLEATFGWYWAADVLGDLGAKVHLAHPPGQQLGQPAGEERRARRRRPRRPAAHGPSGRGVDRPAGDPRAAGDDPLPPQAVPAPRRAQGPGPCGDGQERRAAEVDDDVGSGRHHPARLPRVAHGLLAAPRVPARSDRALRSGDRDPRPAHPPDPQGRPRLQGGPGHPRRGPGAGRGVRGRDRRRQPVPFAGSALRLGRPDAAPPRVRHQGAAGLDNEDGMWAHQLGWALRHSIWR